MSWVRQIFEDIDGSASSKRLAFFMFIVLFIVLVFVSLLRLVPNTDLVKGAMDHTIDAIKWLGGFIASEQVTKIAKKD